MLYFPRTKKKKKKWIMKCEMAQVQVLAKHTATPQAPNGKHSHTQCQVAWSCNTGART